MKSYCLSLFFFLKITTTVWGGEIESSFFPLISEQDSLELDLNMIHSDEALDSFVVSFYNDLWDRYSFSPTEYMPMLFKLLTRGQEGGLKDNPFNDVVDENTALEQPGELLELLKIITPLWPILFGENKYTPYLFSGLWLFYETQVAVNKLEYQVVYDKQLLLKDIIIYAIQNDLLSQMKKGKLPAQMFTESMLWSVLATIEQHLGTALSELGHHTEGLKHFEKGLQIYEHTLQDVDAVRVEHLYFQPKFKEEQKFQTLLQKHEIDTAVLYSSLESLLESKHPEVVQKYLDKGAYQEALDCYFVLKDLLLIVGDQNGINPTRELPNPIASKPYELVFIRLIYDKIVDVMDIGDMEKGESYDIYQEAPNAIIAYQQYVMASFLYNNLGAYYYQLNNYELSLNYLLKAWERIKYLNKIDYVIPALPGYGTIDIAYLNKASTYVAFASNIGSIYTEKREYGRAREFLEDAKQVIDAKGIFKRQSGIEDEWKMTQEESLFDLYFGIGRLALMDRDTSNALNYLLKCDTIAKNSKFLMRPLLSSVYWGHYYITISKPKLALEHWLESLAIAHSVNDVNILSAINGLIGKNYDRLGNSNKAMEYYDKCEKIAKARSQYGVLNYLYALKGEHYRNKKDYLQALSYFEKGLAIVEDSLFKYTLGEVSRQLMIEESFNAYEGAINVALLLGQNEKAFRYLQQSKARTLNELLSATVLKDERIPLAIKDEQLDIIAKLNSKRQSTVVSPNSAIEEIRVEDLIDQLKIVNAKIRAAIPQYNELLAPDLATIKDIQKSLKPKEAFLEYFLGETLLIFVITKGEVRVFTSPKGTEVRNKLADFNTIIDQINFRFPQHILAQESIPKQLLKAGAELYPELFEQIESSEILNAIEHLVIAPDDALYLLPFEFLNSKKSGMTKFLVHDYQISYIQSATTLKNFYKNTDSPTNYTKDLLVLAKSDFTEYAELPNLDTPNQKMYASFSGKVDHWGDEKATLSHLDTTDLNNYRYLYYSTHGKIEPTPELSYLALTNSQLSLYNIFNLEMQNELVVLSACQTAKGTFQRGAGVMGFTRGIMHAGGKSLIISLWPVEETATDAFFTLFFELVNEGQSFETALKNTKVKFQQSTEYHSPFYWAGFVLFGT